MDLRADNCPLCALFRDGDCSGCPVSKAALCHGCLNTPYVAWAAAEYNGTINLLPSGRVSARLKRLAQAELDFLKGLLPKRKPRAKV